MFVLLFLICVLHLLFLFGVAIVVNVAMFAIAVIFVWASRHQNPGLG